MKTPPAKAADTREENRRLCNGFGRRVWSEVAPLQDLHDVQVYGNDTAWWNGYMTVQFLLFHFGHRSIFSDPILLLLDDFSGHWVDEVTECARKLNIVLKKIPSGLTWICQPADVVWMKPVKDRLRRAWVAYLQEQLRQPRDAPVPFQMVPPDRRVVIRWITNAWDDISSSTIKAGFQPKIQAAMNSVVSELENLSLLDQDVGQVRDKDDFVDSSGEVDDI